MTQLPKSRISKNEAPTPIAVYMTDYLRKLLERHGLRRFIEMRWPLVLLASVLIGLFASPNLTIFTRDYEEGEYVERAIKEVWESLAIAFGLVVVVIYVFLHNFRATLIPAVAIPVSIVANFVVMYWLGFSVNILTMLALVLAANLFADGVRDAFDPRARLFRARPLARRLS